MTKPTVPRWAVDTMGVNAVNVTEPSSGQKDTGWSPNQVGVSSYDNWFKGLTFRALDWLITVGDVEFNDVTVAGTLGVTGATTLSSTLAVTGNTTVGGTLGVIGNTTLGGTLGVTGATTLSSTLGVTGAATLSGGLTIPTGQTVAFNGTTTLNVGGNTTVGGTLGVTGAVTASGGINAFTANGLITANGGVTAAANQHVTVSGTGRFKHGTYTLSIPATSGLPQNNTQPWARDNQGGPISYTSGLTARWVIPIPLDLGSRILAIRARVLDEFVSGTTIRVGLYKLTDATETVLGAPVTSNGSGAWQTLTISGLTEVTVSGTVYYASFDEPTTGSVVKIQGLQVDYDLP